MSGLKRYLNWLGIFVALSLLVSAALIFAAVDYKYKFFGDTSIEELVFYAFNGLQGTNTADYYESARASLPIFLLILFVLILPIVNVYKDRVFVRLRIYRKTHRINLSRAVRLMRVPYALTMLLAAVGLGLHSVDAYTYLLKSNQKSTFIEEQYVDPRSVGITAPEKKKNLIYIYLESMENTLASVTAGGVRNPSVIPELEALALDPSNVSFSNTDYLGGFRQITGTGWTVAAMTAQSTGTPLITPSKIDGNSMNDVNQFLPGAFGLGDILEQEGYYQQLLIGSDAAFGGRDKLYNQHGDYEIYDYFEAGRLGKIPHGYHVWWGYEDKKLYEFAKEELQRVSQQSQPFNFQVLTVDTHALNGYDDETCQRRFEHQYDNVYACASTMLNDFVGWIKQQEFYTNTTVVIVGDHLGMNSEYYEEMIGDQPYERTAYNVILNAAVQPANAQNREFSALDMYPTTLAAMGYEIDGDRLGLGVNLFSDQQTLLELYGLGYVNEELSKRSLFYNNKILTNVKSMQ